MNISGKLNYVEFHSRDLGASKAFFTKAFGWSFTDYGAEYISFSNEGLDGGFFYSTARPVNIQGHPVLIFYSENLKQTMQQVEQAGGKIIRDIFSFPGGQRFHFTEPGGNEFAVWSEVEE